MSTIFLLFTLSACGWAEWPPPDGPRSANRPLVSSSSFVGASAVIVGKGDTVYGLSRRHRVSARNIIEANSLRPPYVLKVGQRIVLMRDRIHVVKRGDTLSTIAEGYDANMYAIARINGIRKPYTIRVGQKLRLPSGGSGTNTAKVAWQKPTAAKRKTITASRQTASKAVSRPPKRSGRFTWPVKGRVMSKFGAKEKGLQNDGINIQAPVGASVKAAENGVVAYAGNELRGFGNLLLIKHSDGWITAYAHNQKLLVKRGEKIMKGQTIAKVGSSGGVKSPQLHFELRKGKRAVDPLKHLS
ncbi:MAG: M23 family metallopeptidase [Rhodospirillaceae bacterium]|nr:M23 family metallopeptidase [Rhodospirillaceae bacterium]MBT4464408.1 M23 family metallopeptidase [Rhodospirillaceae bacterium]MBT5308021.1 M23 family metallopeptidase [Rhodospirillaceae bacterium]MBT6407280.1 M23 family metallopeptidase [Rhodospirillaceae bacterium]MBT7356246.1 M23 family metallopeptidase [Rhodospirillaceae bacterium]